MFEFSDDDYNAISDFFLSTSPNQNKTFGESTNLQMLQIKVASFIHKYQLDWHCLMNVSFLKSQNKIAFATTYRRRLCTCLLLTVVFSFFNPWVGMENCGEVDINLHGKYVRKFFKLLLLGLNEVYVY